ncbi:MAG: helix-turn-helix domain-containing protein [Ignavibacteriales bacterium]|nr:helix-turn-helix domain-containing protein [Ignavibacteriales bacterium]
MTHGIRKKTDINDNGDFSQDIDASVFTVRETALFLRISESIVRRLIKQQRIPFIQLDGRYLFYKPCVEEWLRAITVKPLESSVETKSKSVSDEIWNT